VAAVSTRRLSRPCRRLPYQTRVSIRRSTGRRLPSDLCRLSRAVGAGVECLAGVPRRRSTLFASPKGVLVWAQRYATTGPRIPHPKHKHGHQSRGVIQTHFEEAFFPPPSRSILALTIRATLIRASVRAVTLRGSSTVARAAPITRRTATATATADREIRAHHFSPHPDVHDSSATVNLQSKTSQRASQVEPSR